MIQTTYAYLIDKGMFKVFTESYKFNLHAVPFDIHFNSIDNAFMCTA